MKLITAADDRMDAELEISVAMNRAVGYTTEVFHVPQEYIGWTSGTWPERIRGKCPYKPTVILRALRNYSKPIVWLDADAFCVKPIESVFDGSFDVGVTLRRPEELSGTVYPYQYGYVNSGVMFFVPNYRTIRFITTWIKRVSTTESRSDQEALTRLLLESDTLTERGKVFMDRSGARIKLLSTDEYNWYYWKSPVPETAKIVHMKTDMRKVAMEWAKAQLCAPA